MKPTFFISGDGRTIVNVNEILDVLLSKEIGAVSWADVRYIRSGDKALQITGKTADELLEFLKQC